VPQETDKEDSNYNMMKKSLLLIGLVSLSTFAFAGSKTYEVTLTKTSKAGTAQLAPGTYKLKVDNGTAVFTLADSNKSQTVSVKLENAAKKFAHTAVDARIDGSADLIEAIELGGSTTKIEFSNAVAATK
jgi:hypothetical protein